MDNVIVQRRGPYTLGISAAAQDLARSDELFELLRTTIEHAPELSAEALAGRRMLSRLRIESIGNMVVKHYGRGGVLGRFIKRRYLALGASRPQAEFEMLARVRELNVNAPEPLVWAIQGWPLYRGWLVTREIEQAQSLAQIGSEDEDRTRVAMLKLLEQVAKLIYGRIFHVDLHPGNVLVDPADNVFILDFDRAHHFRGSLHQLRDRYLWRWRRAVIKHKLPEVLSEWMTVGLRKTFEQ